MNIYTIYTENKSPDTIRTVADILLRCGIQSATFNLGVGMWEGKLENSLEITLVHDASCFNEENYRQKIVGAVFQIRWKLGQNAVMLVTTPAEATVYDSFSKQQEGCGFCNGDATAKAHEPNCALRPWKPY